MRRSTLARLRGITLVEILIASLVGSMVMVALFSAAIAIQRCFVGAEDFAIAKSDQARLTDYLALDLRRAVTVAAGTDGVTVLKMEIPDYYDAAGMPRTPTVVNYTATYGNPNSTVTVIYRKVGAFVQRQQQGQNPQIIAADVADFQLAVQDLGKVVKTQINFAPRFRRTPAAVPQAATAVFNTTLLRNARKDL